MLSKWWKAIVTNSYWLVIYPRPVGSLRSGVTSPCLDFLVTNRMMLLWTLFVVVVVEASDLFISYTCESVITVVQPRSDHGRDKLGGGTVRQQRTNRRNVHGCKKCGTAEPIAVFLHRLCLTKMYSDVHDKTLKENAISTVSAHSKTKPIPLTESTSMISIFSLVTLHFDAL